VSQHPVLALTLLLARPLLPVLLPLLPPPLLPQPLPLLLLQQLLP
jgi:hypothetical protein